MPARPSGKALAVVLASITIAVAGCGGGADEPERLVFHTISTIESGPGATGPGTSAGSGAAIAGVSIVGHVLDSTIEVHSRPDPGASLVAELDNPTEIGGELVFLLVDERPFSSADEWVEVHLPVRPNGTTGWVRADELRFTRNPYRIEIDTGDHRLDVFRQGQPWLTTDVAIGTGSTPTPIGEFYIIELLQPPSPDGVYGPFAFGLSGFSETLLSYAGGDGVIGIHGTDEPGALGTDVSHGCVRVHNEVITDLAGFIPLGTPVVITT